MRQAFSWLPKPVRHLLLEAGLQPVARYLLLAACCLALLALAPLALWARPAPALGVQPDGMMLPGCCGDLEGFTASVTDGLRARVLGKPCLNHFLEQMAEQLSTDSLWLEFGVWRGRSLNMLARKSTELKRPRKVFGFDSFKGLPENWRNSAALGEKWAKRWTAQGAFDLGGEAPELFVDTEGADFVVGWFNESLPPFLERETGPVSFIHVDSDLYSSAATVFSLVTPRLQAGAVIVFDELINYPGFREGEMRALYEWLESPGFRVSGLTGVEVVGYRGPNLLTDEEELTEAIRGQKGEGRKWPQDAIFRVW